MNNKDSEKRFNQYLQLICAFEEYQNNKGVFYEKKVSEKRDLLEKWLVKKCLKHDDFKLDELLSDLIDAKFDSVLQILADMGAISIDFDKLPAISQLGFKK